MAARSLHRRALRGDRPRRRTLRGLLHGVGGAEHRKPAQVGRRQVPMGRPRRHGRDHGIQARAGDGRAGAGPHREAEAGDPRHQQDGVDRPRLAQIPREGQRRARRDLVELRAAREVPLRPPEQLPADGRRQAGADVPRSRPAAVRRQGRVVLSLRHQLPQERVREERRWDARRLPGQVRLRAGEPAVDQYRDPRSAQGCHAHQPGRSARDGQHLAGHDDLVRDGLQRAAPGRADPERREVRRLRQSARARRGRCYGAVSRGGPRRQAAVGKTR